MLDLEAALAELRAKGVEVANETRAVLPSGVECCVVRDPDGFPIEIVRVPNLTLPALRGLGLVTGGRLAGKVAVVTGAAKGQGEGVARRFVAEGAHVALLDVLEEAGTRITRELGAAARFFRCDVAREEDVRAAIAGAVAAFGGLDVLYNNAAVIAYGRKVDELPRSSGTARSRSSSAVPSCAPSTRCRTWSRAAAARSSTSRRTAPFRLRRPESPTTPPPRAGW